MPTYPTYSVNGTPLQDSAGRWHEHPETQILPVHSGLRSTAVELNALDGEYLVGRSPLEAKDFTIKLVINAVDDKGVRPKAFNDQLIQMYKNLQTLYQAFKLPRMTGNGRAELKLHLSSSRVLTAQGLLVASTSIDRDDYADYATVTFVFRLPDPKWRGKTVTERVDTSLEPMGWKGFISGLADSTASVNDALVTLAGPFERITVDNEYGDGFSYNKKLTEGQAVTVNTRNWSVSEPFNIEVNAADVSPSTGKYTYSPALEQVGQSSATALVLWPQDGGAVIYSNGAGRVPGKTCIYVRTREAYL